MHVPTIPLAPDLAPQPCELLGPLGFAPLRMHTPGPIPPIDDDDDDEDGDQRGGGGGGNIDPDDDEGGSDDDDDDDDDTHWAQFVTAGPAPRAELMYTANAFGATRVLISASVRLPAMSV